ncbi:MAG: hypothetical protein Q9207_007007 [Kuettlingeria erythrocarpa]
MATKQFNKVKTICVQSGGLQERVGLRADFDREVVVKEEVIRKDEVTQEEEAVVEEVIYNEHKVQPNQGEISSFLKEWRDKNGGTHAVMATLRVKKGGDKADVENAWDEVADVVKGVADNPKGGVTASQQGAQQGAQQGVQQGGAT